MSDIQHKSSQRSYRIAEADYSPEIPLGTIEMFNRKFKEWEKRRGLESKSPFAGMKRGVALRCQKAAENKAKAVAKEAAKIKGKAKSPAKSKKKK